MDKIIFNLFIHIIYTSFYEKKKTVMKSTMKLL